MRKNDVIRSISKCTEMLNPNGLQNEDSNGNTQPD